MRVAVLIADLYEDAELIYPYYRLLEDGHEVDLVGCEAEVGYRGKRGTTMTSTAAAAEVHAPELDGVVVPGGYSPDHMRRCPALVDLVREIGQSSKPVGAICHGPWMLASAGLLEGKTATSFFSIRDDLINAGANWVDEETVRDGNVITARAPADLPSFMHTFLEVLAGTEGAVPH
jgi:protease I